jgi:hypothetical protein
VRSERLRRAGRVCMPGGEPLRLWGYNGNMCSFLPARAGVIDRRRVVLDVAIADRFDPAP